MTGIGSKFGTGDDLTLTAVGLRTGDRVRWRKNDLGHWKEAVVVARERDGSVGLRDRNGAARAINADRLEVRCDGPRGGNRWESVTERARRTEQLVLF